MIIVYIFDLIVDCGNDFNCFHLRFVLSTYTHTWGHILIKCRLDLAQPSNQQPEKYNNQPQLGLTSMCFLFFPLFIRFDSMINENIRPNRFFFLRKKKKSMSMRDPDLSISIISLRQHSKYSQSHRFSLFLSCSSLSSLQNNVQISCIMLRFNNMSMSKTKVHFHKMFAVACY